MTDSSVDVRKRLLLQSLAAAPLLSACSSSAAELTPTPWQTPGPYYPEALPEAVDADLLSIQAGAPLANGEPLRLQGSIVALDGQPLGNALVEIWQCDSTGHYHHPADRRGAARDENFQGYGRTTTDSDGRYQFNTIVPVAYPGRTPHIHFAVEAAGHKRFTTQMYVAGETANERDFLYNRLTLAQQQAVTASMVGRPSSSAGSAGFAAEFRIVLS